MSSVANSPEAYSLPFSETYPSSTTHLSSSHELYSSPTITSHPTGEGHPSRRRYGESLKIEAARLVLEQNLSMQKVAGQLHCSPMSVQDNGIRSTKDVLISFGNWSIGVLTC